MNDENDERPQTGAGPRHGDAFVETEQPVLEIDTARKRRWVGTVAYGLFFVGVAIVLFVLLYQFTASLALAWGLVVFMVGYMWIMGWLAARNSDRRSE